MPETSELHLAVALDGAGWHPAAWRSPDARPQELFSAGYWTDLAREAEAGALDFLTIEDSLGLQTAGRCSPANGARPDPRRTLARVGCAGPQRRLLAVISSTVERAG
jgi:alkanesulfonate monooxygenase SsuD/methylene tetrahydromethanopterin reductase-like flavin-dependent oxidoreductase (luciferase family)